MIVQAAKKSHKRATESVAAGQYSRQLAGLLFLLIVFGAIVLGSWIVINWMKNTDRLLLSRMIVTGERHYTTNDDIRQAILSLGKPSTFMTQNVNIIQQKIECMPWIKQVSVRKQWPDELKIHLIEYVPVAYWNDQYFLDDQGKVFSVPSARISNQSMPMLYGPEGSEQNVLSSYHTMNEILTAAKFQLKAVSMSTRHSWQLTLGDDTRLELGWNDRIKRLRRFIAIYPILLQQAQNDKKRISYVDLRYNSGVAVGWASAYVGLENNNQ